MSVTVGALRPSVARIVAYTTAESHIKMDLKMDLKTHGDLKYRSSRLLGSSAGRNWRGIFAELRAHPLCDTPAVKPAHTEITIAVAGSSAGYVTRKGAGQRQKVLPVDGTIWLSPIGVDDNEINIAAPLPEVLHVFLAPDPFVRLADEYNLPRSPGQSVRYMAGVDDELVRQLGLGIVNEIRQESAAGDMLVETTALMLAARLAQCHGDGWRTRIDQRHFRLGTARLRRVLDYIDAHLDTDLDISSLAAQCCLSPYHFSRMFSATVGMPPFRYISIRRMDKAKQLLREGKLPLSQIAQIARFSSQASFTRAFTRETGISPGRYQQKRT
ncbi:AraC family transcriptional regulator [Paraburkholderia phytofirmans]|uniref:helix-turn-helix domain-containing protein n=1 Tax=Paraburkholderia phytofirmans TaxID=261302 RepID=UPI0038BC1913